MELLIRLTALSLCVCAMAALLKRRDETLALMLTLSAVLAGCALLPDTVSELAAFCSRAVELTGLSAALFLPLAKVVAIALVARFSCALCADAGQSALSALLETAGALCALVCALPLLEALLALAEGLL